MSSFLGVIFDVNVFVRERLSAHIRPLAVVEKWNRSIHISSVCRDCNCHSSRVLQNALVIPAHSLDHGVLPQLAGFESFTISVLLWRRIYWISVTVMCGEWFRAWADVSCKNKDWRDLYGPDFRQMASFCKAHSAQFWTQVDLQWRECHRHKQLFYLCTWPPSSYWYAPCIASYFHFLTLLWIQICNMVNLDSGLSGKQELFYFIVYDTSTTSPYLHHVIPLWAPSADTCGFSRLTLRSWYLVVVQQNATFIALCLSKSVGSFLCRSVCDWWLSACLQRQFNWPEGESRHSAVGSIHMVPILLRPIVNIIEALLGPYFYNLLGVFKANGQV